LSWYKEKNKKKRVPLGLTCHPSLEKISGIVRHHWKEIEKSETLAKLFPEPPVVACSDLQRDKDNKTNNDLQNIINKTKEVRPRGTRFFIFFSLYSRRSFLLISLAFENPLSITLSLYSRLLK
jgi:hypothetical protein